jgi:hypothetical protein
MGENRNAYRVLVRKTEREKYLEDIDPDWKMIFICLRIGISGGLLEHRNAPSGSIKCGELLD